MWEDSTLKFTKFVWSTHTNLTNNNQTDNLVFDYITATVLNEESKQKNREDRYTSSQQMKVLWLMRGKSTEHGFSMSHNHCRSKLKSKKNVKWYNCDEKRHVKKTC